MKKLILITTLTTFVLASCHKALVIAPGSTITATINGKYETFNKVDTARFYSPNSMYISGTNDTTSDKIILIVGSPDSITTATYSSHSSNASDLEMLFGEGPGYTFNNYYYTYDINDGPTYEASVTVSSISKTNISGTFNGSVVLEASVLDTEGTRPSKTITNGKFSLIIQAAP
ncbi:MAG: hypothetical protein ACXVAZ_14290 [Mucilaginibacter sp.]